MDEVIFVLIMHRLAPDPHSQAALCAAVPQVARIALRTGAHALSTCELGLAMMMLESAQAYASETGDVLGASPRGWAGLRIFNEAMLRRLAQSRFATVETAKWVSAQTLAHHRSLGVGFTVRLFDGNVVWQLAGTNAGRDAFVNGPIVRIDYQDGRCVAFDGCIPFMERVVAMWHRSPSHQTQFTHFEGGKNEESICKAEWYEPRAHPGILDFDFLMPVATDVKFFTRDLREQREVRMYKTLSLRKAAPKAVAYYEGQPGRECVRPTPTGITSMFDGPRDPSVSPAKCAIEAATSLLCLSRDSYAPMP